MIIIERINGNKKEECGYMSNKLNKFNNRIKILKKIVIMMLVIVLTFEDALIITSFAMRNTIPSSQGTMTLGSDAEIFRIATDTDYSVSLLSESLFIESVTPNGEGARVLEDITVNFLEPMDKTAGGTVKIDDVILTGGWWVDYKTYKVTYPILSFSTEYTISISGFKKLDGTEQPEEFQTFTTEAGEYFISYKSAVITPTGTGKWTYYAKEDMSKAYFILNYVGDMMLTDSPSHNATMEYTSKPNAGPNVIPDLEYTAEWVNKYTEVFSISPAFYSTNYKCKFSGYNDKNLKIKYTPRTVSFKTPDLQIRSVSSSTK